MTLNLTNRRMFLRFILIMFLSQFLVQELLKYTLLVMYFSIVFSGCNLFHNFHLIQNRGVCNTTKFAVLFVYVHSYLCNHFNLTHTLSVLFVAIKLT